jgi:hypothetical protein
VRLDHKGAKWAKLAKREGREDARSGIFVIFALRVVR